MLGKTHISGGVLASLLLCNDIVSANFLIIGSILPDIDHSGSMLGKNVPLLPKLLKHRGITHSILFCVLISFINLYLGLGCLVHILMDMLTKNGVQLFYPLSTKIRFPFAKYVTTNGYFEKIFLIICYLLIAYFAYIRYNQPGWTIIT